MNLRFSLRLSAAASLLVGAPWATALDFQQIAPSVPRLINLVGEQISTGSGFIVSVGSGKCIVATNHHVVSDEQGGYGTIYVARRTGQLDEVYRGKVVWADECLDLALVEVTGMTGRPIPLNLSEPETGTEVYSVGYPGIADEAADAVGGDLDVFLALIAEQTNGQGGKLKDPTKRIARFLEPSLSEAKVRRITRSKWNPDCPGAEFAVIEHDVNIGGGNSGGPLLNACGQVVGINTAKMANQRLDWVNLSSHIRTLADAMRAQGVHGQFVSGPCAPGRWGATTLWLFASFAGTASAVALIVALRKPALVRETYTQFLRRSGGWGAPRRRDTAEQGPPEASAPLPSSTPTARPAAQTPGHVWVFTASDPASSDLQIRAELLARGKVVVGRRPGHVHLFIGDESVSGQHAAFSLIGGTLCIEDLGSSNGTRVNGQQLAPHRPFALRTGDHVELGSVRLELAR